MTLDTTKARAIVLPISDMHYLRNATDNAICSYKPLLGENDVERDTLMRYLKVERVSGIL